jgi:hypothetical protein
MWLAEGIARTLRQVTTWESTKPASLGEQEGGGQTDEKRSL